MGLVHYYVSLLCAVPVAQPAMEPILVSTILWLKTNVGLSVRILQYSTILSDDYRAFIATVLHSTLSPESYISIGLFNY